jgi:hypothetical protein
MKKRIGSKIYDTEKGIPVLPEKGLYKQPKNRTFYLFDGKQITPISFDYAAKMIREAGDPALLEMLEVKPSNRGCVTLAVTIDRYYKLERYAKAHNVSMKSIIEAYIDSLPEA